MRSCIFQPGQRVQRAERLIEQQKLRLADEGARERNPLLLAARQHGGPVQRLVAQADVFQQPLCIGLPVSLESEAHIVDSPFSRAEAALPGI